MENITFLIANICLLVFAFQKGSTGVRGSPGPQGYAGSRVRAKSILKAKYTSRRIHLATKLQNEMYNSARISSSSNSRNLF